VVRDVTDGVRKHADDPRMALAAMATLAFAAGPDGSSRLAELKGGIREAVRRDPMEAALVTVLGGAYLFWLAERDVNPRCRSYWDALVFISTCLNVGYAQVYAVTPAGKALATAVMTFGPALVGAILDPPSAEQEARDAEEEAEKRKLAAVQDKIAGTLEQILVELRASKSK
jgi:hypothetical protein